MKEFPEPYLIIYECLYFILLCACVITPCSDSQVLPSVPYPWWLPGRLAPGQQSCASSPVVLTPLVYTPSDLQHIHFSVPNKHILLPLLLYAHFTHWLYYENSNITMNVTWKLFSSDWLSWYWGDVISRLFCCSVATELIIGHKHETHKYVVISHVKTMAHWKRIKVNTK